MHEISGEPFFGIFTYKRETKAKKCERCERSEIQSERSEVQSERNEIQSERSERSEVQSERSEIQSERCLDLKHLAQRGRDLDLDGGERHLPSHKKDRKGARS